MSNLNYSSFYDLIAMVSLEHPARYRRGSLICCFFFLVLPMLSAEGTRQLAPTPEDITMLLTNRVDFSNFAAFDGPADSRLYITVDQAGEEIYLGLTGEYSEQGAPFSFLNSRYRFRIRRVNPNGADPVVHGPFVIDITNANVSGWEDAVFGAYGTDLMQPNAAKGNQLDYVYRFAADQAGDYYIEFEDEGRDGDPKVLIGYWDITVARNGAPAPGRVWSRNWALRTPVQDGTNPEECGWDRKFNGMLYSYTADGFVSRIDFTDSGFQGLAFTVAFNMTGPGTSGDFAEDRKSIPGANATNNAAQHQIFLNEPDPAVFPDGECGTVEGSGAFSCTGDGSYCLDVSVTRPGQVDVILDFDGNGRFDANSADVVLVHCFEAGQLNTCVAWDGVKGDGAAFVYGERLDIIYVYTQGVQNWAVYDGEFMKNGFCVEAVRPACGDGSLTSTLYWDDRNIGEDPGTGQPKDGRGGYACRREGSRTWTNFQPNQDCSQLEDALTAGYGDKNTLNTWWFAAVSRQVAPQAAPLTARIAGPASDLCAGERARLRAEVSASTSTFGYRWEGPGGFTAEGNATIRVKVAGTYCVTVTDEQGCEASACYDLTFRPNPELNCTAQPVSCQGGADGSITVAVTGGAAPYRFMLNDGAFQNSNTFTGLAPGEYNIIVQDKEGCSASCTVAVGEPAALTCTVSDIVPASCSGEANGGATVTAAGGNGAYTYAWDNGETTATATALGAGLHSVTVTDAAGCSTSCEVRITEPEGLMCTIEEVRQIRCAGETDGAATVLVQGGTAPYVYAWDNGETTATATGLAPGEHSVTVTDGRGCTVVCSAVIETVEPVTCSIGDVVAINCLGEATGRATVTATGGNGSYHFKWDNGEEGATATRLSAGTHTVTVTDGKGCGTTCSVDIPAPAEDLSCSIDEVLPAGCDLDGNGRATVTATGGNGGYTYAWDNGETTATATALAEGVHEVTVTDAAGCSATCSVTIGRAAELSCSVTHIRDVTCKDNSNGIAEAIPVGGVAPYSFAWDNGETTARAEALAPGDHRVTVTDAAGCSTVCSVRISNSFKEFSCWGMVDQDAGCEGGTDGVAFVMPSGGVEPYSYQWSNGATSRVIENLSAGTYTVTVTDGEGCRSVCAVSVGEPQVRLLCPPFLEVRCSDPEREAKIAAWAQQVGVLNSCEEAPIVTNDYAFEQFSGNCLAEQTVTFSHVTPAGRVATCQGVILLVHDDAPEMSCPPTLQLSCTDALPEPDFAGGRITSACGLEYDLPVTWAGDEVITETVATSGVTTILRTYEATDNCGNTVRCTQVIEQATDTEPPVLEPSAALSAIGDGGTIRVEANYQDPDWDPIAFTAADVRAVDEDLPVAVGLNRILVNDYKNCTGGIIQRWQAVWTAIDGCNSRSTFSIFVEVTDTTAPALENLPDSTLRARCDALPEPDVRVVDNGLHAEVEYIERYLTPFCGTEYQLARTWTPIDACGNTGESFTQIVTVRRSQEAPAFYFPSPHLQELVSGDTYATDCQELSRFLANDGVIAATAACGSAVSIRLDYEELQEGGCADNEGTAVYRLTWTAQDECARENRFVLFVEVVDREAPALRFADPAFAAYENEALVALSCEAIEQLTSTAPAAMTATDNCDPDPLVQVETAALRNDIDPCGASGSGADYRISWTATDRCGNSSSFALRVILVDNTPPTFVNVPPDLCTDAPPPVATDITAVDNCGGEVRIVYEGEQAGDCFAGGSRVVRTWSATDACGNRSRYQQYITYGDNFAPYMQVFGADGDMISNGDQLRLPYDCESDLPYGLPAFQVGVFDFCEKDLAYETTVELLEAGNCAEDGFLYRVAVTYTATDACGNEGRFSYDVELFDDQPPVFEQASLEQFIYCTDELPDPVVRDCGEGVTLTLLGEEADIDLCDPELDEIARTWEAIDACGNRTVVEQVVIIAGKNPEVAVQEPGRQPKVPKVNEDRPTLNQPGRMRLFPNPVSSEFSLDLSDFAGRSGRLLIYNAMGQVVHTIDWDAIPAETVPVAAGMLGSGLHTAVLRTADGEMRQQKFIVSR